jgi:UDP-N-acetyl-D-glucosamine dehydrogenase
MTLLEKLQDRSASVGIIGLGYVGLSLAREFATARYRVLGVDIDKDKIERLRKGHSYVLDVPSEELRKWIESGQLTVSTDCSLVREMDAISICVPTPLRAKSKDPDLSFVLDAVHAIRDHLRPQQLVILESTTFPGTTTEVIQPMLEASGLTAGRDFFLAFSPERVDPGNRDFRTRNIPKVVGGVTPECARHAEALYRNCLERVVAVSSPDVAEMVKLLENTFRTVNIGLVNEFALLCSKLNIDVWEVIEAASTKPFGFMPFYPGPGLGGHCIPVDPHYLSWKAKVNGFHPKLIDAAVQVNQEMPRHIVRKVREVLKGLKKGLRGSKILIVGVAYKRNTDDVRESPALEIIELLKEEGAEVRFSDPFVPVLRENGTRLSSSPLDEAELSGADCVLVVTDHSSVDYALVARHAAVVVDTRNALKDVPGENIHRL